MDKKDVKVSVHQLFWYFFIFSVIGLILETFFCLVTTGVLESRKGLLLGPYCPIYGVGAVFLIYFLRNVKLKNVNLALSGFFIGSIIEYVLSYILETMYNARFWDYSYVPFNLNGRICLSYSLYWAIISIILMKHLKPFIDDKVIVKVAKYKRNLLEIIIFSFMVFDCLVTVWAVTVYETRAYNKYYNIVQEVNAKNSVIKYIENNIFSDKVMVMTFPNLRMVDKKGDNIFIKDILSL